jgi:hypothetical protein
MIVDIIDELTDCCIPVLPDSIPVMSLRLIAQPAENDI